MSDSPPAAPPPHIRRIGFLGSPAAAVPTLSALAAAGFEIPLVVSQPDRRRGRGSKRVPSPVKAAALELGLDVSDDPYDLVAVGVDVGVVVAYGRLLRRDLLEQVPMVNVHFSLLPRWRGAAPVERAILAGDTTTGVCVMGITEGLDEGPVYGCAETAIGAEETAVELTARLADFGAELLVDMLSAPLPEPTPQSGTVTHAAKLDRSENELDFTLPAAELQRRVRIGRAWTTFRSERFGIEAVTIVDPAGFAGSSAIVDAEPGRVTLATDGEGDKAIVVSCGNGTAVQLVAVKPSGKRAMNPVDWWNGAQPGEDVHLGR